MVPPPPSKYCLPRCTTSRHETLRCVLLSPSMCSPSIRSPSTRSASMLPLQCVPLRHVPPTASTYAPAGRLAQPQCICARRTPRAASTHSLDTRAVRRRPLSMCSLDARTHAGHPRQCTASTHTLYADALVDAHAHAGRPQTRGACKPDALVDACMHRDAVNDMHMQAGRPRQHMYARRTPRRRTCVHTGTPSMMCACKQDTLVDAHAHIGRLRG